MGQGPPPMWRMDRVAACLMIASVIADPSKSLHAEEAPAAQVKQIGETIEDAGDDAADWILRLFRGVDEDTQKPRTGSQGGKGSTAGQGSGAGSGDDGGDDGGGDDGGDDGGGDDGGGDDGGDD